MDVHCEHLTFGADDFGEPTREVAGAGADISDDIAGPEWQALDQQIGAFLFGALRSFEPISRLVAHDVGDFAAHVELTDAVAAVLLAEHVVR